MIFDPRSGARKPPKESVELILSVDGKFNDKINSIANLLN